MAQWWSACGVYMCRDRYVCKYVCVGCVCVCVCVCVYMCVCIGQRSMWAIFPQVLSISILVFETWSLTEPEVHNLVSLAVL